MQHATTIGSRATRLSRSTSNRTLAVGALLMGGAGALFGLCAFLAVAIGDDRVPFDVVAVIAAGFAVLGLVAVALVNDAPGPAAIGMATVTLGDVILFGNGYGPWWTAYQRAVATGGAAETAFWAAMPALGLFAVSALLFALGAMLAALRWDETTPLPNSSLEGTP
jgi:hypothetical protein